MRANDTTGGSVDRRTYLKALTATGVAGVGLSGRVGATRQDDDPLRIGFSTHFTSGAWVTALVEATEFYAQDRGFEFNLFTNNQELQQQVSDINQMVNQEYDGMVVIPVDTEGVVSAVEEANDAGVPVFTADIDAATEAVKMNVSWSDEEATTRAANLLVERLSEQRPDQDSYRILEVRAPPGRDISRLRHEPFVNAVENTDGVEIAGTIVGDWARSTAQTRTLEWINANDPPDGIYAANFTMGLGAQSALESQDLQYPSDHEEHITHVQLDGSSETHQMISEGYMDAAIDQPVHYYGPLAMNYLAQYIQGNGEETLPAMDSEVTGEQVSIEPAEHKGTTLWDEPIWEPATIGESFGHRQFVTNYVEITDENADAPYLWGNIWG